MTRVAQLRDRHKAAFEERGAHLTYMAFILKAVVEALKAYPVVNASVDGDSIVYHRAINVGVAVALDWGLIVPVVHDADEKNVLGLARAISDLAERARTKKLRVGGGPGRYVHDHEPRRVRQPLRHADHQPAAGRDPRRRHDREASRRPRRRDRDPDDGLPLPDVRPPHRRRRRRRPLHGPPQEDPPGVRRSGSVTTRSRPARRAGARSSRKCRCPCPLSVRPSRPFVRLRPSGPFPPHVRRVRFLPSRFFRAINPLPAFFESRGFAPRAPHRGMETGPRTPTLPLMRAIKFPLDWPAASDTLRPKSSRNANADARAFSERLARRSPSPRRARPRRQS